MNRDLILAAERRWQALNASPAQEDADWVRQIADAAVEFGEDEVQTLAQVAMALASRLAFRVVGTASGEALIVALAQAILERGDLTDAEIDAVLAGHRRRAH